MIDELILLRDDDRNGGTMHKGSTINPQQTSRTVTTTLKFFFNQGPKKRNNFLANIPQTNLCL